jgi:drug/metabolite transporter (DMT)-like permease
MQWIILCLIAALLFSISVFIDNYLIDVFFKGRHPQAIKVVDAPLYFLLASAIALIFGLETTAWPVILIAVLSGAITSLASIPYYLALRDEEATTATIFFQISPILCIIGDFLILGHNITAQQIYGFVLVLVAPLIVALSRRRKKARKIELHASLLLLLYVILYAIGSITYAKAEQGRPDAMTLFFWFNIGRACFDTSHSIISKKSRKRIKQVFKTKPVSFITAAVATLVITAAGDFLMRYSYSLAATSLVSALTNASELVLTFILGIILTLLWPKFGREKLSRHIIASHLIAVILIVIGIFLVN